MSVIIEAGRSFPEQRETLAKSPFSSDRRGFLTGKSLFSGVHESAQIAAHRHAPVAGHRVRLSQRSMACDFSVILNAGIPKGRIEDASLALDLIAGLEQQLSVYLPESEMSLLNADAVNQPIGVESRLFSLLFEARRISKLTDGAFDPTSGPLVALWRRCRDASRIPSQAEIDDCLVQVGMDQVEFNAELETIRYKCPGVELNLGAIGKGYALDRAAAELGGQGVHDMLLHGGHSSLLARGDHNATGGWPVGIGNPLFTGKRLGTLVLRDCAMATSGSNIQYFRHQGRKYGHILDPRTGWPTETMLSVTVLAPNAAMADALSTAFYVMGVEKVGEYCDNLPGVSALVIPIPIGKMLEPVVFGIPEDVLYLDHDQLAS